MKGRLSEIKRLLFGAGMIFLVPACVGHAGIEGAPCPCPDGYLCCDSLNKVCIKTADQCPDSYPPSSGDACNADSHCARTEACNVWKVEDRTEGPSACRRRCPDDIPCATGETCALVLHGGFPLQDVHATRLCVPEEPPEGCQSQGCSNCDHDQLGKTFCNSDDDVQGCFLALHPVCGLTCRSVVIQECAETGCELIPDGAKCVDYGWDAWCLEFSCEVCGEAGRENGLFCDGDDLVVCVSLDTVEGHCPVECNCETICQTEVVETCPAGCAEDGGAHCM